jgi:hypothetical protein
VHRYIKRRHMQYEASFTWISSAGRAFFGCGQSKHYM